MAAPIVQFVDSISTTATLRYDFNQSAANYRCLPLGADGIDFGVPSFTGEPEGVGGYYSYRQLRFTQRIIGTRAVALARMSVLAKELLRQVNYLRFQWDPSASPVFFKTYRTEPGSLSLENAGSADAWDIAVPLEADPFAYGPRQTIATSQVIQAPADLAGPVRTAMHVVLPTIKGEAPTPLRVAITPAASGNNSAGNSSWLIGCIAGTASMTDPIIDIGTGDAVTSISGTAGASTDATYFGGSYRTVTVAAATPNLIPRFWVTLPNTIPIGRYKVLLRCRYTAGVAQTLLFRLAQWPNGSSSSPPKGQTSAVDVFSTDTGRNLWVDLGEFQFPFGTNPPTDAGGTAPFPIVAVDIGTASGAASSVNVDAIKLIPVDGPQVTRATLLRAVSPTVGALASAGVFATFDGDLEICWSRVTATGVYVESPPSLLGGYPIADPAAAQNLLLVIAADGGAGSSSATSYTSTLNAQLGVDVSYYPRYLHIGDGT